MLYLMTTPYAYSALREEIERSIRDGVVSKPIRSSEGEKLPYLQVSQLLVYLPLG
jgi:hypothetical protein